MYIPQPSHYTDNVIPVPTQPDMSHIIQYLINDIRNIQNYVSAVSLYVDHTSVTVRADSIELIMRKLNNAIMLI
jgi:hypothetical protein